MDSQLVCTKDVIPADFPPHIMNASKRGDAAEHRRLHGELLLAKVSQLLGDDPPLSKDQRRRLSRLVLNGWS